MRLRLLMTEKNKTKSSAGQRLRFGVDRRLRKKADFDRGFNDRLSSADGCLIVRARPNRAGRSRMGVSVGKRFGCAVRRNRCKRTLREAFRLLQYELPEGYDYVLIPRRRDKVSTELYRKSLLRLCRKINDRYRRNKQ